MKISMRDMAVDTFADAAELPRCWTRAASTAAPPTRSRRTRLHRPLPPCARCRKLCAANDAISRLTGRGAAARKPRDLFADSRRRSRTIESVRATPAAAFDGAGDRDCSSRSPATLVIAMNGFALCSWCCALLLRRDGVRHPPPTVSRSARRTTRARSARSSGRRADPGAVRNRGAGKFAVAG